jgi:hypothetical protein
MATTARAADRERSRTAGRAPPPPAWNMQKCAGEKCRELGVVACEQRTRYEDCARGDGNRFAEVEIFQSAGNATDGMLSPMAILEM